MARVSKNFRKAGPICFGSFILAALIPDILDIGMFWYLYPKETPPPQPESDDLLDYLDRLIIGPRKVCTKSGTYQITAPKPEGLSKLKQKNICQIYVEAYEQSHNTWRGKLIDGPMIKRLCGISLDDILNNISRGGTSN